MGPLPASEQHLSGSFEPIAIVGMACRWPGDSETPSELWDFLQAERDAYSKFPADRIKTESFYHPNGNRPGSFYTEGGCFLKSDVRNFDHTFFGIHPKEVLSIDPAQRKFLEVVYEAFESGGVPLHKLAGSRTGCFVGNFNYDHQLMQYRDAEYPEPYSVTGGGITVLSNRVNYVFDLKGPSMTLDTACSSSMYALHLACSAIHTGECTAAVVGGSNLILTPECQIFSSVLGAVSPTSICHTFDASADGYARADGISALYIKRLSEAVKDSDPIRAVIRGTAINANGRTGGITHPSPDGQEAVIRRAYERAGGLDPSLTGYFECHGTGTAVGDPLEVTAIGRVFSATRTNSSPLFIGSIKPNMGHSEPTSGIAGIMKAVLAIEHGVIPPTIGVKNLNPNIDLMDGRLKVVTQSTKWPALPVRRASVNSFGYGGANAHTILDSVDSILPGYRHSIQVGSPRGHGESLVSSSSRSSSETRKYSNGHRNGHGEAAAADGHTNGYASGCTNGHTNGYASGSMNGHTNGYASGSMNGHTNGYASGSMNGHTNGYASESMNGHTNEYASGSTNEQANGYPNGHTYDGSSDGLMNGDSRGSTCSPKRNHFLLPFSAHDEMTLRRNIAAIQKVSSNWNLIDLAHTLGVRRSIFSYRTYIVAEHGKPNDIMLQPPENLTTAKKLGSAAPTLAFVFTGQGAQWPQMGLTLMHEFPGYLETIRNLDAYLNELQDGRNWTIEGVLGDSRDQRRIYTGEISQPLVTAIQIALVNLLASWNIKPAAVVGHSSGEIAAAYAAGLITENDAITTAYLRGKSVSRNSRKGSMMAVGLSASAIESYLAQFDGRVIVACYNSPESLTLSGDEDAVAQLKEILDAEKVFARLLSTGGNAYHSHHMKSLGEHYEYEMTKKRSVLIRSKTRQHLGLTNPAFFSSVYGKLCSEETLGPQYWRKNLESPVLFTQAVTALVQLAPVDTFIEIGPHGALKGPLRQIGKMSAPGSNFPDYLSAMLRKSHNVRDLLSLAGSLFMKGHAVDLGQVNAIETGDKSHGWTGKIITDLPHYQWHYPDQAVISENRYTREWRLREHPRHDILGSRIPGGIRAEPTWRNVLRDKDVEWLGDHRLGREIVFPSTGYLSMALEAATQIVELDGRLATDIHTYEFQNVSLQNALIIPEDDHGIETLFTMRPAPLNNTASYASRFQFSLTSVLNEDGQYKFLEHCRGAIDLSFEPNSMVPHPLVAEIEAATQTKKHVSSSQWYEQFARAGLCYGPIFQGLSSIKSFATSNLTEAKIDLKPTSQLIENESRYVIHPAALDAAMQLSILASHSSIAAKFKKAFMPIAFESIKVWPKVAVMTDEPAQSIAKGNLKGVRGLSANLVLVGVQQKSILEATNILLISSDQTTQTITDKSEPYTRLVWKPEFDLLDDSAVAALYPTVTLDDDGVIPALNHLALHQLIHFRSTHPEIFQKGSKVPHLQRLLDWTNEKLTIAQEYPSSAARQILGYDDVHRAKEIDRLSALLKPRSSESRLMCHLYRNLPAIYSGEKTGIQVALQDNLLIENYESGQVYKEGNRRLASMLALLGHQTPGLKILEVGGGTGSATKEILPALQGNTLWRKYVEYRFTDTTTSFLAQAEEKFQGFGGMTYGAFDMEKSGSIQGYEPEWDLVVASNVIHATSDIKATLLNMRSVLKPGGKMVLLELTQSQLSAGLVLGTFSDFWKGDLDPEFPRFDGPFLSKSMWRSVLPKAGFGGADFFLDDYTGKNLSATVVCATAIEPALPVPAALISVPSGITLIRRGSLTPFISALGDQIKSTGLLVDSVRLESVENIRFDRFLFLVEVEKPLFLDASPTEWDRLKLCLKCATSALWVTTGDLLRGGEPLFAMISGIARGLKTEVNYLRFSVLDLDQQPDASDLGLCDILLQFEKRASNKANRDGDAEFRRKDGITYISRLISDDSLNQQSKVKAEQQLLTEEVLLESLRSTPVRLDIDKPGVLSTLYFREDHTFASPLANDSVEIEVQYAGINNKDIAVVTGRHHSDTFSDECAGIIINVGVDVTDFVVGDRVYCQSFAKFGNFVRDKASFCQKLEPEDNFESVATMPIAFCTAIYGLMDLGRLSKGESVLIQSATGAVGLAAIQIARLCGAEIYATVGTPEKKESLLSMGFDIKEDHILWSRDPLSPMSLMQQTGGRGVDVILCSARGELMHAYWRCIATLGRFIEIGRTEILDNGRLNLDVFRRNATFASFDLEVMSKNRPDVIGGLMAKLKDLKSKGFIKPLPHTTYHASEIDKAFMIFGKGTHIGKLVITYDHDNRSGIKLRRSPFTAAFDPEAAYLLVGCLGGLGRSFSKWAVQRGARNLIYLARTGAAKAEARLFINSLREQGVDVKVVKGDVTSLEDVKAAITATEKPIRGVIQGALTLNDGLFETMTLDRFYGTIKPRVIGTLNLHEALKNSPLDFFQMWGSWTLMFGTATQSNYLASNAFMDAFARHRHSLGLPATSLALSQILGIGIVSYMPEYQQAMIRNGFYGNDEDEFLQFCEAGICPPPSTAEALAHDPYARGHLLVGIEPAGLKEVDKQYPIDDMVWSRDPRFKNLTQATHLLLRGTTDSNGPSQNEGGTPAERIQLKVSRLLYVPLDEVDLGTAISFYGIDSMIAAELRNWLFTSFGKDVSLLNLLSPTMTIQKLAEEIGAEG